MPPKLQVPIPLAECHPRRKPHIIQEQRPRERRAELRICHAFPNAAAWPDAEGAESGSCERDGLGCHRGRGFGDPALGAECEWGGEVVGAVVDGVVRGADYDTGGEGFVVDDYAALENFAREETADGRGEAH